MACTLAATETRRLVDCLNLILVSDQPMQVIVSSCLAISGYHGHMRSGSLKVRLLRKKDTDKDKKGKKNRNILSEDEIFAFSDPGFWPLWSQMLLSLPHSNKGLRVDQITTVRRDGYISLRHIAGNVNKLGQTIL